MTCPHCGGSNFQWASKCDHCGHALADRTGPAESLSASDAVPDGTYVDVDAIRELQFQASLAAATPNVFATTVIVAVNLLVFAAMVAKGISWTAPSPDVLIQWGANYGPRVGAGEWWRLVTAAFVHGGIIHIAMNMIALWSGGRLAERLFGQTSFVVLYAVTAVAASLASVWVHPVTVSVGASGAIFGVYGGIIAFVLVCRASLPSSVRSSMGGNLAMFVMYNLLYGVLNPRVDVVAHIAGLVAGVAAGAVLAMPFNAASRSRLQRVFAVSALSAVLFVVAARRMPVFDDWAATLTAWQKAASTADARYSEAATQLAARQLTPEQFAERIDNDFLPELARQQAALAQLRLPAAQRKQADKVGTYLTLKKEALELAAAAERSGDKATMNAAGMKAEEALAAMAAVAQNPAVAAQIGEMVRNRQMDRAFVEELERLDQLDKGCTATFNRELSRLRSNRGPAGEIAFASSVEQDVVTPWKTELSRLQKLRIPAGRQPARTLLLEYMTLRGDAWQMTASGVRTNNRALVEQANDKHAAALKVLASFNEQAAIR